MIANLDTLLEQIREYNQLKFDILESFEDLTEEEIEDILVDVAEEYQLTIEEAEQLVQELFGIGSAISRAGTAVKRVGSAVASPFRKTAAAIKGVGQRVGRAVGGVAKAVVNKSREMDARGAEKAQQAKTNLQNIQNQRAKAREKLRGSLAGETSFSTRVEPAKPKSATPTKTKPVAKPAGKETTTFSTRLGPAKPKPKPATKMKK